MVPPSRKEPAVKTHSYTSHFVASTGLLLALAAGAAFAESPIRIESDNAEPLAGRDYSMRVDVAAARFERYDAASGRTELAPLAVAGAKALAPGLWLAVPQANGVALLPLGTNPSAQAANVEALALPAAVVARIHDDGGVVWVDAHDVRTASTGAR